MKKRLIPPAYFNIFIPLAVVLHYLVPIKRIIYPPTNAIGLLFIALGLGLNMWSSRALRDAETSTDFHNTPDHLVLEGPYRFSRNPIYLGGVILLSGIALLLGSLITFVFPAALLLILDRVYIPVEEGSLEAVFGRPYLDYRARVRRWI